MKVTLAPVFVAATVLFLAACGSGQELDAVTLTVPTMTTIANAKTGALVRCGSVGAHVPAPGHGVAAMGDGAAPSSSASLQLKRLGNGSLVVTCRR
ncbi:MAG TPA: hypothetical protein VGK68_05590 [Gaiellaceae bacterium]